MNVWTIVRFGSESFQNLSLVIRPDPVPGPRDVVIRMHAAALNYRDLLVLDGRYGLDPVVRAGMVPMSDGAGEVIATGAQVRRVKVGDRVAPIFHQYWIGGEIAATELYDDLGGTLDGVLAQKVVMSEEGVVLLPDSLSYAEAACLPCAAVTAWSALMTGRPSRAGETLLVQGSGGVSIFALQLGKALGMRVIAMTSSEEKADRLRALGADQVVNYRSHPEWGILVRALADGKGVDRIVEVGGPGTFAQSIAAAGLGAHIAVVGLLGGAAGDFNPLQIIPSALSLQGILVGSRTNFEELLAATVATGIKPVIDRTFAFHEVREAYRYLHEQHHFGKVIVRIH